MLWYELRCKVVTFESDAVALLCCGDKLVVGRKECADR